MGVGHLIELGFDSLGDMRIPVAETTDRRATRCVEIGLSVRIKDVGPLDVEKRSTF